MYLWYNSHMAGNIESEGYGAMANNIICMFGISLFEHTGYCDVMEDGIQYKVAEWDLCDMKKYNGKYAVVGFDGSLRIYEETGEELFSGSLLDSADFARCLKGKI